MDYGHALTKEILLLIETGYMRRVRVTSKDGVSKGSFDQKHKGNRQHGYKKNNRIRLLLPSHTNGRRLNRTTKH